MSVPLTNHTLEKLEQLLFAIGFKVRYEKVNFKTGSCLLEREAHSAVPLQTHIPLLLQNLTLRGFMSVPVHLHDGFPMANSDRRWWHHVAGEQETWQTHINYLELSGTDVPC